MFGRSRLILRQYSPSAALKRSFQISPVNFTPRSSQLSTVLNSAQQKPTFDLRKPLWKLITVPQRHSSNGLPGDFYSEAFKNDRRYQKPQPPPPPVQTVYIAKRPIDFLVPFIVIFFIMFVIMNIFGAIQRVFRDGFQFKIDPTKALQFKKPPPSECIPPDVSFDDVVGIDSIKEELQMVVDMIKNPEKYNELGAELSKGLLLYGPPGTGKTLLARAIAGEAGIPLLHDSGSAFDEVFVGLGAQRVRELFAKAKALAPCIIFIDELDALGSKRGAMSGTNQTLNQMLSELDGFNQTSGIFFLGATNLPQNLDPAFVRAGRIDKKIMVPLPDKESRQKILSHYLAKVKVAEPVDVERLSNTTIGLSGADLKNLVNQATILAAVRELKGVSDSLLRESFVEVLVGKQRSVMMSDEDKKLTAYHESGHALAEYFANCGRKVSHITILPHGQSLGHTLFLQNKEHSISRQELYSQLDGSLGGRAGEELIFGTEKTTLGFAGDLEHASKYAHTIVQYGFSSLGVLGGPHDKDAPVRELITKEVDVVIKERYNHVKRLLSTHRKKLDALATRLMEKETLSGEEVKTILDHDYDRDPRIPILGGA